MHGTQSETDHSGFCRTDAIRVKLGPLDPWIGHPPAVAGTGDRLTGSVCDGLDDGDVVGCDERDDLVFFPNGFEVRVARTLQEVASARGCRHEVLVEAAARGQNKILDITKAEVACHVSGNAPCGVGKRCHSRCQMLEGACGSRFNAFASARDHSMDGRWPGPIGKIRRVTDAGGPLPRYNSNHVR